MTNVLLLEENKPLANILKTSFEKHGFSLKPVHHSSDVVKELEQNQYDLFIIDAVLSFKGGAAFLKQLQKDPTFKIPMVLLTSSDKSFRKQDGWTADKIIRKPFQINRLINAAEELAH